MPVSKTQDIQKQIYENKLDKGFNVTNIELEFCLTQGELAEAYDVYRKKLPTVGEELADVAIYLYGLAEILGYNLDDEIEKKVKKNKDRIYKLVNGVQMKQE
ncbi:MAG TPA: MazG-like family protein [Candidatus Angelobacter sp.]|nr:MazG-like family protein [Candidatus Angelobacter sp.]